jgi:hypothetical protein
MDPGMIDDERKIIRRGMDLAKTMKPVKPWGRFRRLVWRIWIKLPPWRLWIAREEKHHGPGKWPRFTPEQIKEVATAVAIPPNVRVDWENDLLKAWGFKCSRCSKISHEKKKSN